MLLINKRISFSQVSIHRNWHTSTCILHDQVQSLVSFYDLIELHCKKTKQSCQHTHFANAQQFDNLLFNNCYYLVYAYHKKAMAHSSGFISIDFAWPNRNQSQIHNSLWVNLQWSTLCTVSEKKCSLINMYSLILNFLCLLTLIRVKRQKNLIFTWI